METVLVDDIFYNKDGILVRRSRISDIDFLSTRLRKSDVQEIWDSHNHSPRVALDISVKKSIFALTVEDRGEPVAIFGINAEEVLGSKAVVWMLATDKLDRIRRRFARHSRKFIDLMLGFYPVIYNYVSVENMKSLEWLRWMGASFKQPQQYGIEGKIFQYFSFERK